VSIIVMIATMDCVSWYNQDTLHSYCGDMPLKEYEEISIRQWSLVRQGAVHRRSDLQTCRGDPRLRRTATPGRNPGKRSLTRH
jgi:hypothetical protein